MNDTKSTPVNGEESTRVISVKVPAALEDAVDAYLARLRAKRAPQGEFPTRGDALRSLLIAGLRANDIDPFPAAAEAAEAETARGGG